MLLDRRMTSSHTSSDAHWILNQLHTLHRDARTIEEEDKRRKVRRLISELTRSFWIHQLTHKRIWRRKSLKLRVNVASCYTCKFPALPTLKSTTIVKSSKEKILMKVFNCRDKKVVIVCANEQMTSTFLLPSPWHQPEAQLLLQELRHLRHFFGPII